MQLFLRNIEYILYRLIKKSSMVQILLLKGHAQV